MSQRDLMKQRMDEYLKFWFTDSKGRIVLDGIDLGDLNSMFEYMMTGDKTLIEIEWSGYGN